MRLRQSSWLAVIALLTLAGGCSQQPAAPGGQTFAVTLANAVCPIMGGPVDEAVTAEWNGKIVGFCCAQCIPEWNELTDEERAAKLAAADSAGSSAHDHDHDHEHAHEPMSHDAS